MSRSLHLAMIAELKAIRTRRQARMATILRILKHLSAQLSVLERMAQGRGS